MGAALDTWIFDWQEVLPTQERLTRILEPDEEDAGPTFKEVDLKEEHVEGAKALGDSDTREILRLISEAVFARQRDVLNRQGPKQSEIASVLETLQEKGLLGTEYLLECRQTGTALSRLSNPKELEDEGVGRLSCASCGAAFKDENLHEGYSLSEVGRTLLQQSHWMTVWVTDLLVRLGIPKEAIAWNVSESGEEVDIIVDFLEQLWIFELKDREFGAGDAHPFNYRQVRYGADVAVIVTTGIVSKDAKRVFDELSRDASVGRRARLVYVEGLAQAEPTMADEISRAGIRYARQRLALLSEIAGIDIGAILAAKYTTDSLGEE